MTDIPKEKQKWNEEMYSLFPTRRGYEHKNFIIKLINEGRVKTVLNFLDIKENDRVIEIGCEAGYLLKQLPTVKEVVGLDIARNALEDARKNVKSNKVGFVCADASDIPFRDNYFDKVICSELLEHVNNPDKVIAEIHRIVKPEGSIVISVPYESLVSGLKKFFVGVGLFRLLFSNLESRTSAWHIQNFNRKTICKILNKYFEIQRFKYVPIPFIGPGMVIKCVSRSHNEYES